jgi:hypothetical protein
LDGELHRLGEQAAAVLFAEADAAAIHRTKGEPGLPRQGWPDEATIDWSPGASVAEMLMQRQLRNLASDGEPVRNTILATTRCKVRRALQQNCLRGRSVQAVSVAAA